MTQTNKQINFSKALRKLESFLVDPIVTERDRAGLIQAFEFTFGNVAAAELTLLYAALEIRFNPQMTVTR